MLDPAHLLGQDLVVRRARPSAATTCWPRTRASTGTPSTSRRAASGSGWSTTSTGRSRVTGTGARRCRCGAVRAVTTLHRVGRRASGLAGATSRTSTCTVRMSTTSPSPASSAAAPRAVWRPSSTPGSTRARCRRPSSLPLRGPGPGRPATVVPGPVHLRGHRPDARLVLLAAGGEHPRLRVDPLRERGLRRPHRRRRRPEDVEVARQRDRPVARVSIPSAPTRSGGTSSPSGQPWSPRRVHEDGIRESTRQTLLTLWNVWSFFATYADLDGWYRRPPSSSPPTCSTGGCWANWMTRWQPSPPPSTTSTPSAARPASTRFVDDLSNWYVRRSRPRFWKSKDASAYATLHRCLVTTTELLAPFCPFLADDLWRALTGGLSVHAADWPVSTGVRDNALSTQVDAVRRLVALGRAARTDGKVKTVSRSAGPCCCTPASTSTPPAGRAGERAQREGGRHHRGARRHRLVDSGAQLPHPRPSPRPQGQRREGRPCRRRRGGRCARRSTSRVGSRWPGNGSTPATSRCGPSATASSALAQEGPWPWPSTRPRRRAAGGRNCRELSRAINDLRQGARLRNRRSHLGRGRAPDDGRVAAALAAHGAWIAGEKLAEARCVRRLIRRR